MSFVLVIDNPDDRGLQRVPWTDAAADSLGLDAEDRIALGEGQPVFFNGIGYYVEEEDVL